VELLRMSLFFASYVSNHFFKTHFGLNFFSSVELPCSTMSHSYGDFWSSKKKALTLIVLCLFGSFKLIQKWNVSSGLSSCCVLTTVIVSWWFWIQSRLFYRAVLVMYRVWEIISRLSSLFHNLIRLNLSIWLKLIRRI